MNSNELVLRIRSPSGLQRLTTNKTSTVNDLKAQIEKLTGIPVKDQVIRIDSEKNPPMSQTGSTKLSAILKIEDGSNLWVKSSGGNYNAVQIKTEEQKKEDTKQEKEQTQKKQQQQTTVISASGKTIDEKKFREQMKEEERKIEAEREKELKKQKRKEEREAEAKHRTFEEYLGEMKIKTNLVPDNISYKMKLKCGYHAPYPQAMCSKCMPPAAVVKRQEFRHVDYAEFMNTQEVANFIKSWIDSGCSIQRGGLLYGYYAEDPNYKGGVRAIVEAIYEPPQKGEVNSFEFEEDPDQSLVDMLAESIGLERIGWIFTSLDNSGALTSYETRMAARLQEQHKVQHPCGYKVSKFITVVMRHSKENPAEVVPDVYMVSDLCQQLEADNIFDEPENRKELKIREPVDHMDIIPSVIQENKPAKVLAPDFFIVNVAHGRPKHNKFSIIKLANFPVENTPQKQKPEDIKSHLKKYSKEKSYVKFADFHLLLYIAKFIDKDTALTIASCVGAEVDVPSGAELLFEHIN